MNNDKEKEYISLKEAEEYSPYSADYLKLRARQGKLRAIKIGKIWVTKREWVEEYVRKYQDREETVKISNLKSQNLKSKFQKSNLKL